MTSFFNSPPKVIGASIALRAVLLVYGAWQDAHSPIKYTDIDYLVFTDAARYVSRGASPYARDTYRYTPLLAWFLLPTTWDNIPGFFSFGKALFALADVVAGWLIASVLVSAYGMNQSRALKYASVWLLNPMVANISTRGSSEGLLGVLVVGLLWAVLSRRVSLAGVILGLGVHFKIYPFIYGPAVVWWLDAERDGSGSLRGTATATARARAAREKDKAQDILSKAVDFLTPARIHLTLVALATFSALNVSMYILYGLPFAHNTYLHHLTRIDHRHNFSPYSTLLYLSAAGGARTAFESLAFIPQLLLSVVVIPLVLGKKSLAGTMLAQTFAFVTFNKYFLWYLIFLPFYLPSSSLMKNPRKGVLVGLLWVVAQALWLQQGYNLEFLGLSSFVPGLFLASLFFFAVNVWILGIIVEDVGGSA
ncbi:glycosylphosphatidylinositol-alpha 1,4 mannosyltransferase I [Aspergillus fischeri NRRL 181]|uniref:GPI mannosyltransferase 1 n=1 Tax=Neosartorya fischeri (strain ATCC 1020 / DSM 3700 / CBS 544.65 / FGSC A1164 / JCM 1740 / NRRL 181 / WB 181) TaxID=331117 RepID=A1D909_NEOFI|nr:mannosyltransferase (PIG-M), putative [Aspergillus fischeri NRRL 181]EAW20870.1 mannosyltransferase (PIG-M), putative [Aspergillus fischeri NRRL 181]